MLYIRYHYGFYYESNLPHLREKMKPEERGYPRSGCRRNRRLQKSDDLKIEKEITK